MWHIDINDEPAECTATVQQCPKLREDPNAPHFEYLSDALAYKNRMLVEKYGTLADPLTKRGARNNALLEQAFKKLNDTVVFEEGKGDRGKKVITAKGKEVEYTIKEVPNGRAFVYYTREGVQVRPSSWHENVEEAKGAVTKFDSNW